MKSLAQTIRLALAAALIGTALAAVADDLSQSEALGNARGI